VLSAGSILPIGTFTLVSIGSLTRRGVEHIQEAKFRGGDGN